MKNNRSTQMIAIIALIISTIGVTIGLATISTTLTINGASSISRPEWNVHFENLSTPTIKGGASVTTAPTLTDTSVSGYNIKLTEPGDAVTYTFDIVNSGNMNAILGTFTKNNPTYVSSTSSEDDINAVAANLIFTLTYQDGTEVKQADPLDAKEIKKVTLTIGYSDKAANVPASDVEVNNLSMSLIYNQN